MQLNNFKKQNNKSFTLIELLVVLALVAILSVVVVMTLNPAELIKQARDSNRLSDLSTINTALNLFSADVTSGFMGTSTVVYVSIPDTSPTCANLGLPALPTSTIAWTYKCATSQNLRNVDGTGWIPVNFQRISSNSPISQLPVDSINTTTTRLYYTYVTGGSWELNATIEASKNKLGGSGDLVSKDGGSAASQYEIGNNLALSPIETGDTSLVGYWNFDSGTSGLISNGQRAGMEDSSGNGNGGIAKNANGTGLAWSVGKIGKAVYLDGVDDVISVGTSSKLIANNITFSLWLNLASLPATHGGVMTNKNNSSYGINLSITSGGVVESLVSTGSAYNYFYGSSISLDTWSHLAVSHNESDGRNVIYVDGQLAGTLTKALGYASAVDETQIGSFYNTQTLRINGLVDDVRVYSRALTASEILALYNSTK